MSSLIEANPYLSDPHELDRIIADRVRDSSLFEGARGLPRPTKPRSASRRRRQRRARRTASRK